jgi:hypothetical protein
MKKIKIRVTDGLSDDDLRCVLDEIRQSLEKE